MLEPKVLLVLLVAQGSPTFNRAIAVYVIKNSRLDFSELIVYAVVYVVSNVVIEHAVPDLIILSLLYYVP